jgi:hypothetical protein
MSKEDVDYMNGATISDWERFIKSKLGMNSAAYLYLSKMGSEFGDTYVWDMQPKEIIKFLEGIQVASDTYVDLPEPSTNDTTHSVDTKGMKSEDNIPDFKEFMYWLDTLYPRIACAAREKFGFVEFGGCDDLTND